jgi:putative ABC transport system permease protein
VNPREALSMSLRAIRGHPLRSSLTALGVLIGVAAVIVFVILGASLQAAVIGEVGGEDAERIYVWNGPEDAQGPPGAGARAVFTEDDIDRLRAIDGVDGVAPYASVSANGFEHEGDTIAGGDAVATGPDYFTDDAIAEGRAFESGENEVVLTPLAAAGFEEDVAVGDRMTVTFEDGSEAEMTVVGILEDSGPRSPFDGFGEGARVYMPADPIHRTTAENATGGEQRVYPYVVVTADSPENVEAVTSAVRTYLEGESDASEALPGTFGVEIQTNEDLLEQVNDLLATLTGFITGIALISLLVGSIGIANVMLVSVTERTREIGIMKTVGAQKRDVLQLFLTEAAILGLLGAAAGAAVGFVGGYVATRILEFPFVAPLEWALIAVVTGVLVGALAGLYPAWNAARTDPIEALRYE